MTQAQEMLVLNNREELLYMLSIAHVRRQRYRGRRTRANGRAIASYDFTILF